MKHKDLTRRWIVVWLMCAGLLCCSDSAWADGLEEVAPPIRKLSRGLANTVTGVLEIPLNVRSVGLTDGPVAGMSLGLMVGLGAAVSRTALGLIEVVTFPFPLPQSGYEPLLQPEFLLQPETTSAVR
jgi:putative exosortase-associated protein (TIGR04073 family)